MKKREHNKPYTFTAYSIDNGGNSWEKIYLLKTEEGDILREVREEIPSKYFTYSAQLEFPNNEAAVKWFNKNYRGF